MRISRRQFAAALTALPSGLRSAPLGLPPGFQAYSVRDRIARDFEGTLRELAAIGYRSVEMCSPAGYGKAGFGALAARSGAELKRAIASAGLRCESCHFQFRELKENLEERIAWSRELGLKQMVAASFGIRQGAGMAGWIAAAEEMNRIGALVRKAGLALAFHNHNTEFEEIGGVRIYDELMRRMDAKLVGMQFQVAVVSAGHDPVKVLEQYPGRFLSLHLADWSAAERKMAPVGQGVIDWKKLFAAARRGGVKNYYVEMEFEALKASYPYLRDLKA